MKRALVALLLTTISVSALAQYPGGGGGGEGGGGSGRVGGRRHVDPDGAPDGKSAHREPKPMKPITRADFETKMREQFAAADFDHDGYVTLAEIRAAHDAKRDARISAQFAAIDTNHDGSISRDEFLGWQRHMGDPEMTERRAPPEDHPATNHDDAGGDGDERGGREWTERDGGRHRVGGAGMAAFLIAPINANMIIEADTNHDGNMSLAEDIAYQNTRFDAADTNHDGTLDDDEIRAAREKMRKAQQ